MTQPTGEHATGVELAAGYVKVDVQTNEGIKRLNTELEATEAHAKVVGEHAGANIVTGITAAGEPAAKGFTDKLRQFAQGGTKDAAAETASTFGQTFKDALRNSRLVEDSDWLFNGFKEKSELYGAEAASSFHGRFIQLLAANRIDAGREAEATGAEVAEGLKRGTSRALEAGGEGLFSGEVFKRASEGIQGLGRNAGEAGTEVGEASEKLAGMGGLLAPFMDPAVMGAAAPLALAAGFGVVIDKLYELGEKWEEVNHSLQIQTGATGEQLKGLEENVKAVAGQVPLSIQKVGSIVATAKTAFQDTGDGITQISTEIGNLQSMVGAVDLTSLGRGFRAFGIGGDAQAQVDVVNQLFKAYQATQVPINTLVDAMARAAPIAKQFHLSIGETVAVMTQFDQAGIDPSRTMFSLAKAAQEATKEHKDFSTVLNDEIEQIRHAGSEQAQLDVAGKFFGKTSGRGGAAPIVAAVNAGLTLDPALLAQIEQAAGLIDKTRHDTESWADVWTITKNRISGALQPISDQLREHVQAGFEHIAEWLDANQGKIVTFATSVVNAFEKIGEGISVAFNKAVPVVKSIIEYLRPGIDNLMPHIEKLGQAFVPLIKALGTDLLPILKVVGEALVWALGEAIKYAPPVVDALTHIVNALTDTFHWLHDNLGPIWNEVFGDAKAIIDPVVGAVEAVWHAGEKVVDYFDAHILPIIKNVFGIWLDLMKPIIAIIGETVKAVTGLGEYIGDHLGPIFKIAGGIIHDTFGPLLDVFKQIWDVLKKIGEYVGHDLTKAFDDVGKATASIKSLIDMVPGLGHSGGGPPATTHGQTGLALGGYGGGDIVPAMLEPGEHVWTKEEVAALGGHANMYRLRAKIRFAGLHDPMPMIPGSGSDPDITSGGPIVRGPGGTYHHEHGDIIGTPWGVPMYAQGGGMIHPAGQEHREKSWVIDRYKLSEPGKTHFQGGGDVGQSWWSAIKSTFDPNPMNWFKDDPDKELPGDDASSGSGGFWADILRSFVGSKQIAPGAGFGHPLRMQGGGDVHDNLVVPSLKTANRPVAPHYGAGNRDPHDPVGAFWDWLAKHPPDWGALNPERWHFQGGGEVGDPGLASVIALLSAESGRTPYAFGGYSPRGIDCSGLVAEAVQVYLGEQVNVGAHPMSTGNEASWLAAHGFKQGIGPEGSFRVGFYNGGPGGGHTALTLPDGTNAEAGGSGGGVRLGGGAAGAGSAEFSDHWYLPPRSVVEPGGYGGTGPGSSGAYGGAGGAEGASYGGAGGGGGTGPTPEQVAGVDSRVSNANDKLNVLNQKITEAQQHLQEVEAKAPKTAKGEPGHERAVAAAQEHLKDLEAQRDQAQGDLDSVTQERASLTGDNDPKALVSAKDRITDANIRLNDAQAKLDRDRADPKKKPSEIMQDENNVARAKERVAKAEQHLQELESKPAKRGKGEGGGKDADFVSAIGDAAGKGLLENLPQGFSDPTSWGGVKSAAALMKFLATAGGQPGSPLGMLAAARGTQGAAGLSLFGDILGGKGGDAGKDIASLINPQAYTASGGGLTASNPTLPPDMKTAGGGNTANVNNTQNITNNGVDPAKATVEQTAALHRGIRSDVGLARYATTP
jgi:phage-related protein